MKEIIYNQKYSGAAAGFFNANIIARDLGLANKIAGDKDNPLIIAPITGMKIIDSGDKE